MIDLKRLRDDSKYRKNVERKRVDPGLIDGTLAVAELHRDVQSKVEELRARQNALSKEIRDVAPDEREQKVKQAAVIKEELAGLERQLSEASVELSELALQIPNAADDSVPDGGEDEGEVIREVGDCVAEPPSDFAAYGEHMGWVETKHAREISGSRFAYLMREAVQLEFALVQWVMGKLVSEGFVPAVPPVLVRQEMMEASGFFPTDRNQVYEVDRGRDTEGEDTANLFLTGTSEIALAGLHKGDLLGDSDLPLRYCGFSTCFRREAGTYGKDTRGIFRVHQFDKVEMFVYADPSKSEEEHERLLGIEEWIVQQLGLPYRVVNIATGDLGAPAAKKYDVEAWLPSEQNYRELTSCSNYTDFSARRLGTRFRGANDTQLVHTLNGTGCAVGRTLLFLWEHYQQTDGSFKVPDVLRPFTGFDSIPAR